MKTIFYYLILIVLVIVAMLTTSFILGLLFGYDAVGVKGAVAGAGILVISSRKRLFDLLDRLILKK